MAPFLTKLGNAFGFGASLGGAAAFSATGGSVSTPGDGYKYHSFPYPNESPDPQFVVSGDEDAGTSVVETTIEVMCQGSGGAGGGGQPGPHNRISGGGGGGGATGVWQIAIDKAGTYNVTAISGFNGGGPGSAGAGDAGPGAAKFAQSPALGSGYVIAYGGEGGKAGGPQGDNPGGEGGTNATSSWTAASLATDIAGEDGTGNASYGAKPGGNAGGDESPYHPQWWYPFMDPGEGAPGRSHGNPQKPADASNFGGGGAGGQGGVDGGEAGPGGESGGGIVVVRYPVS